MRTTTCGGAAGLTAGTFVGEIERFRATLADPSVELAAKQRAWDTIVRHAALLDPQDAGFWLAGAALKDALCAWLDAGPPATAH